MEVLVLLQVRMEILLRKDMGQNSHSQRYETMLSMVHLLFNKFELTIPVFTNCYWTIWGYDKLPPLSEVRWEEC